MPYMFSLLLSFAVHQLLAADPAQPTGTATLLLLEIELRDCWRTYDLWGVKECQPDQDFEFYTANQY